jgi:Leucine-rich repeat (LRR) protein
MAQYKLKIAEYFDVLANKLDLVVEASTDQNCYDKELISGLNKQREAFLSEINECQDFNLKALSNKEIKPDQELNNEDLFPKFCFFIEYVKKKNDSIEIDQQVAEEIGLRLIVTDKYLTEGQIECYEKVFNSIQLADINAERRDQVFKSLGEYLFEKVKPNKTHRKTNQQFLFVSSKNDNTSCVFRHETTTTEPAGLIIKELSAKLFNFTQVEIEDTIGSIRSDAHFLFENLGVLKMILLRSLSPIQHIAHTIDQFEKINAKSKKIDSIELVGFSGANLNLKYNIKKLLLFESFNDRRVDNDDLFKLQLKRVTDLELHDIKYRKLDSATFEFCASTLEKLSLKAKHDYRFDPVAFSRLANLKELSLSDGIFNNYNNDIFKNLTKLTKLVLSGVKMDLLNTDSLKSFVNLKWLDLSRNLFKEIKSGVFNGLSNLTHLNLENSALVTLEKDVFQGLRNLENLNLYFSKELKSIGAGVFSGLSHLKTLDLSECPIEVIDPDAFDDSQEIEFLNLRKNRLRKFLTKCSPRIIDLTDNKSLELTKFIGKDLSNIEDVNLYANTTPLKYFNSMFEHTNNLNIRNFTVNYEALDTDATFSHMKSLKSLTIYKTIPNNPIRISHSALHGLTNLESFMLYFLYYMNENEIKGK